MKGTQGWIGFASVLVLTSGAVAALATFLSRDPLLVRALGVSAGLAAVVQYAGFAATKYLMHRKLNLFAAWGGAMAVRFVSLAVYALVVLKRPDLMLPPAPSLVTFAALLLVTSIVEPLFLNA
ncbi:MAG TPA: hypothetical protein VG916_10105 [Gemmatimonadaceae bacterium]|nr:hypothetical protein [Gemmatimonadaceae bacterium]